MARLPSVAERHVRGDAGAGHEDLLAVALPVFGIEIRIGEAQVAAFEGAQLLHDSAEIGRVPGIDAGLGMVELVHARFHGVLRVGIAPAVHGGDDKHPRVDGAAETARAAHAAAHARCEGDGLRRIVRQAQIEEAFQHAFAAVQPVAEMFARIGRGLFREGGPFFRRVMFFLHGVHLPSWYKYFNLTYIISYGLRRRA